MNDHGTSESTGFGSHVHGLADQNLPPAAVPARIAEKVAQTGDTPGARWQTGETAGTLSWGDAQLNLVVAWKSDVAPYLAAVSTPRGSAEMAPGQPLVELLTSADGHAVPSARLTHTRLGLRGRLTHYARSECELRLRILDREAGIQVEQIFARTAGVAAVQVSSSVTNVGGSRVILRQVSTVATRLGGVAGDEWQIDSARSSWIGENRWRRESTHDLLPVLASWGGGHDSRGHHQVISSGTWSTSGHLPVAVACNERSAVAWAWQVEHNGEWRWDLDDDGNGVSLSLSGPTHADHAWVAVLDPGQSFTTVPVSLAWGRDRDDVIAQMTFHRRATRRAHPDNVRLPVIFNDYMNTLFGDPSTKKLLPLIDAASAAGAEVFCIDAGWYDDGGDWWPSVGEWRPSTSRFPNGIEEVITHIRNQGMVAGLWVEPEVVGVLSPVARTLPPAAFMQVAGEPLVEAQRYHLDLRHPAARAHLDEVIDRLVDEFGIGYFKFDYNIDPGTGSDFSAVSTGAALLDHNRAHLDWLDAVLDRHPDLIIENCGSGAMRSDWAMLSRLQLQSTSDQEDFRRYPPIAASAPLLMLPEQAANWAYPQPNMSDEENAFTLTTGLAGRLYLSGHLDTMTVDQLALVKEAVDLAHASRVFLIESTPTWPLGLPHWDDSWVALVLQSPRESWLFLWNREPSVPEVTLPLAGITGAQLFPTSLPNWSVGTELQGRSVTVRNTSGESGARIFRLAV